MMMPPIFECSQWVVSVEPPVVEMGHCSTKVPLCCTRGQSVPFHGPWQQQRVTFKISAFKGATTAEKKQLHPPICLNGGHTTRV